MKGTASQLFTVVIFLAFLLLFTTSFFSTTIGTYSNFTSNENVTILKTGSGSNIISSPPICTFTGNIALDLGFFGVCIGNWVGWIFNLSTVSSDVQWLGIILLGCIVVIGYIALKILSGFIPLSGGVN